MKLITKLTPASKRLLFAKRDEWIRIGRSTDRADFKSARAAIEHGYRAAGKEPPKLFLHFDGPAHGLIARSVLASSQVSDQVSDQVRDQVRAQVLAQVSAQVSDQVRDQVRAQV
ncbi:MAG TPA: hypothetical protein VIV60_27205, partial [Polyangiaceae bacterium]